MAPKIVIGYDDSAGGEDALALGLRLSAALGETPVVATVYPDEHPYGPGRVDAEWVQVMREHAEERLARAREIVGADVAAEYRAVGAESAAHGLDDLAESEGASMIVVGSSHRCPPRRVLPGSTGDRLLYGAAVPVMVTPRGTRQARDTAALHTVGCAFIDTPDGHEALAAAAALARRIPGRLRVYTVIAPRSEVLPQWIDAAFVERAREQARQALDEALADLAGGVEASAELLVGDVVDALAALDERDVSLLVCGSRGYGPVRRVLLGGISARLVRHAAAPVMVVPRSAGDVLRAAGAATAAETA